MNPLQFKCTLLSDVIINQKSATEGSQATLDFIPGSNFLGIAASALYKDEVLDNEARLLIFHSGKVRFGDAHPASEKTRALRVPASMYYPKLKKPTDGCYIHHYYAEDDKGDSIQLKQCREDFYAFNTKEHYGLEANVLKSFAIKSAYDRDKRRSKDEQMYGYQSIDKGTEFFFEVSFANSEAEGYEELLRSVLEGVKHVGRSRTAQYGLVKIEAADFENMESTSDLCRIKQDGITKTCAIVYADSRLIFLDEYGLPTFRPSAKDLGFEDGTIVWEKSQLRTFQYAPWNYKRQARDADRCGIEKGSVFVVETKTSPLASAYVGCYQNEGFGRVIYNPSFLEANQNGSAIYELRKKQSPSETDPDSLKQDFSESTPNSLIEYLVRQEKEEINLNAIYQSVDDFVDDFRKDNLSFFSDDEFSSQWGTIRSLATTAKNAEDLAAKLYDGENAYLTHGVASDKWQERGRLEKVIAFIESKRIKEDNSKEEDRLVILAVIHLAATMANEIANNKDKQN